MYISRMPTGEAPYVGRVAHRAALDQIIRHVAAGRPALVVVRGEAGIGKTRLLEEFQAQLVEAGWSSHLGRCTRLVGPTLAYGPWKAALGTDAATGWAAPPDGRPAPSLDQVGDAVLALLARWQAESPVVLILEDLHWADRSSLKLLDYVVRGLPADQRVLLCVSARDDEAPAGEEHYVDDVLAELLRLDLTAALSLEPLTREEARTLAMALTLALAGEAADAGWVDSVARRSGGNPYFIRQLAAGVPREDLPPALHDVLVQQLERAGSEVGKVVDAIALAGVPVPHRVLERVLEADPGRLDKSLDLARRAHLVDVQDGRYVISHPLLAEVAVRRSWPGGRERLHARLAEAFTHSGPDGDRAEFLTLVAEHWFAAGDREQAIRSSAAAATAVASTGAHPEAQRLYGRALDLARQAPTADRETAPGDLARRCAEEAYWAGDPRTAMALLRELLGNAAESLVDGADLRLDLARALRAAGQPQDALAVLEQARTAVLDTPPSLVVVRTHVAHAALTMATGRYHDAVAITKAALPLLERVTDGDVRPVRSNLLNTLGVAVGLLGEVERGLDLLHESLNLAHDAGSIEDLCRAHTNTAFVLANAGRFADAATVSLNGLEAAREHQVEISAGGLMLCNALEALVCLGRWAEAEQLVESAIHRPFPTEVLAAVHHSAAQLALGRGSLAQAHRYLVATEEYATSVPARQFHAQLGEVRAEVALADREPQTAIQVAQETLDTYASRDEDTLARRLVIVGLRALADLSQRPTPVRPFSDEEITQRAELLWSYVGLPAEDGPASEGAAAAGTPVQVAELGLCRLELARLHGTDDPDSWQRNAATWAAVPRPWLAAYAGLRGAEAALRQRKTGRPEAARLLAEADQRLVPLGEPTLLGAEIDMLRQQARLQRPAPARPSRPNGPAKRAADLGLTAREFEILPMLADGLTNKDIGHRLFISDKTASVHVTHIMDKLQVKTRGQAAAAARQLGILSDSAR
jgi:DNA-binding CsgD family transcriptional regulator/tetratricopeptide (TPR) repeat protein